MSTLVPVPMARRAEQRAAGSLSFWLNGTPVLIADPDPTMLLVDWLRSPEVSLTGAKVACKQGGCGACTVLLSSWEPVTGRVEHRSVNSCLRPLAALDGMLITTVEGTGSVKSGRITDVQECLAENNGTQCGFCTTGWVMNMTAAVAQRGPKPGTKEQIEGLFDGNICRCTGYRPILYGFKKQFASDWNPEVDEKGCMTCQFDSAEQVSEVVAVDIRFPDQLRVRPRELAYSAQGYHWYRPVTLDGLLTVLRQHPDRGDVRLVGGNTSIGVYPRTVEDPHVFIDVSHIRELHASQVSERSLRLGAGITYQHLIDLLDERIDLAGSTGSAALPALSALRYLVGRTAGTIVRNAATLAGNTMMVIEHADQGVPFPSDSFTALAGLGATVTVLAPGWPEPRQFRLLDLVGAWSCEPALGSGAVLLHYDVPLTVEGEYAQTYKTALREVNAHSIVNAGIRIRLEPDNRVAALTLVVGGLSPAATRLARTEAAVLGRPWDADTLAAVLPVLEDETTALIEANAARYAELPNEGISREYQRQLVLSFFFTFFVEVRQWRGLPVSPADASVVERSARPVSRGTQSYVTYPQEYPGNLPIVKLEALVQTTGEAVFVHDLPLPRRGLSGAPVQSAVALGTAVYRITGRADPVGPAEVLVALRERFPAVADYVSAIDVPGPVFIGTAKDDPVFAVSLLPEQSDHGRLPVGYDPSQPMILTGFGQSIGMVLAEDEQVAQAAAWYLQTQICVFTAEAPVLELPDTDSARGRIVFTDAPAGATWYTHIWKITRGGSNLAWVPPRDPDRPDPIVPVIDSSVPVPNGEHGEVPCTLVSSTQKVGSQLHFYLETQSCVVELQEDRQVLVHPSTQDADAVQAGVAGALELTLNQVDVRVRRVGGGYGGKCGQSVFPAVMAAVAAWKQDRPVRLAGLRQLDSAMFGHRHAAIGNYTMAIADRTVPELHGKLLGFQADYWLDGGRTYDCSFVISDCLSLRSDSAYWIPNWNSVSDVCRTNKTTNTSMRTVGMLQASLIMEDAIEAAAHSVGLSGEDVRERNLYQVGQSTPYGEPLPSCYLNEVWQFTLTTSEFRTRQAAVEQFNSVNRWRKRGISLVPVKYGSGFNLAMLEQGGALIEVYDQDGTVLVRHGGIEMGQGLNTKMAQIVAVALNVPMSSIRVAENDTAVVPNPESTGASTGTSFNGAAAQRACRQIRGRLETFCFDLLVRHGPEWCHTAGVDFWAYPEGWRATPAPTSTDPSPRPLWQTIVSQAFSARVNLSGQARVRIPGGTSPDTGLTFKPGVSPEEVDFFDGYTFSAACTEVEIDVLTGETTILRSDLVYDAGHSLNPAIDVGQVEGGFVQGLGYVISEELTYQPADSPATPSTTRPAPGALYTVNTWEYKPPAAQSIPLQLNTVMFPRELAPSAPDRSEVLSAKEIGEPPMTLAVSAFFAIKKAVLAARRDRGHEEWFQLEAPATVTRVRQACLVESGDLGRPADPGPQ